MRQYKSQIALPTPSSDVVSILLVQYVPKVLSDFTDWLLGDPVEPIGCKWVVLESESNSLVSCELSDVLNDKYFLRTLW